MRRRSSNELESSRNHAHGHVHHNHNHHHHRHSAVVSSPAHIHHFGPHHHAHGHSHHAHPSLGREDSIDFDNSTDDNPITNTLWGTVTAAVAIATCAMVYVAYVSVLRPIVSPMVCSLAACVVLHPIKSAVAGSMRSVHRYLTGKRFNLKKLIQDHAKEVSKAFCCGMDFSLAISIATISHLIVSGESYTV